MESVEEGFVNVARSIPNLYGAKKDFRAFRAIVGTLHLAARLLELDETLEDIDLFVEENNDDDDDGVLWSDEDEGDGDGEDKNENDKSGENLKVESIGSPLLGRFEPSLPPPPSTIPQTVPDSGLKDVPEGAVAVTLLQSQYVETQAQANVDPQPGENTSEK